MTIPWNPLDIKAGGTGATTPFSARRALGISEGASSENMVSVKDSPFRAKGDGVTDDTAAFVAARDSLPAQGGTLIVPPGTYVLANFRAPLYPRQMRFIGAGPRTTILQARDQNTPIIIGESAVTPGIGTGRHYFGHFGIKAHASGSTGAAIDLNILSSSLFEDIDYFDNGTGKFTQLIRLTDAASGHCYNNTFRQIRVYGQQGPSTMVKVENTSNLHYFDGFDVINGIGAAGPLKVFDLPTANVAGYFIRDGHFEGLPGTVVLPTECTVIENNWFESIGGYAVDGTGVTGARVWILRNHLAAAAAFNAVANTTYTLLGNSGASDDQTYMESRNGHNNDFNMGQSGVRTITQRNTATNGYYEIIDQGGPYTLIRLLNGSAVADGGTAMLVLRKVGADVSAAQVSLGAADSGGAGFKLLRIPNS